MTKEMHIGSFRIAPLTTGDKVVTGCGFEPTGLMLKGGSVDAMTGDYICPFFAVSNGVKTNDAFMLDYAAALGKTQKFTDAGVLLETETPLAKEIYLEIKSFDADGFTVLVDTNTLTIETIVIFFAFRSA